MIHDTRNKVNLKEASHETKNGTQHAARMIGYLSHYSYLPEGEVVDEMLAILSDRNAFIKKKEMEQAQAKINVIYEYGLGIDDE